MTTVTINADPLIDAAGNITVHGRSSITALFQFNDGAIPVPNPLDATIRTIFFEVQGLLDVPLVLYPRTSFVGSILGNLLTVVPNTAGWIALGDTLVGPAAGTRIIGFGTGIGQDGTYTVNNPQTFNSATITTVLQSTMQLVLDQAQVDTIPVGTPVAYCLRDTTGAPGYPPQVLFWGTITVVGYTGQPPTGPA